MQLRLTKHISEFIEYLSEYKLLNKKLSFYDHFGPQMGMETQNNITLIHSNTRYSATNKPQAFNRNNTITCGNS
jgi:hypothetical protein